MATVAAPPQHLQALALANRSRLAGAAIKREVAAGLSLGEAMNDPRAAPVAIMDLLMAQHRWGTTRAARLLVELRIGQTRRVRELTARQRAELAQRTA